MKLILLGPQGAGKGTLASFIKSTYNLPHISTGDIFREAIKNQTELGKKVSEIVKSGALVPDDLTYEIVKERLVQSDCKNGFILDGFPRNHTQAVYLNKQFNIDKVVLIDIPRNISVERLSTRRTCRNCGSIYNIKTLKPNVEGKCDKCNGELYQREDDKEDAIVKRLEIYENEIKPLLEIYKDRIVHVDGSQQIDDVNNFIKNYFG